MEKGEVRWHVYLKRETEMSISCRICRLLVKGEWELCGMGEEWDRANPSIC